MVYIWVCRQRVLTLGRRVAPSEDASPAHLYIYTRVKYPPPFMFFNTKHKKIVPIICSFKAESVLLPCYSFPAKKKFEKSFIL